MTPNTHHHSRPLSKAPVGKPQQHTMDLQKARSAWPEGNDSHSAGTTCSHNRHIRHKQAICKRRPIKLQHAFANQTSGCITSKLPGFLAVEHSPTASVAGTTAVWSVEM